MVEAQNHTKGKDRRAIIELLNQPLQAYPAQQRKTGIFIRAGQKPTTTSRTSSSGLLSTAEDWELKVDLGKQLEFPGTVAVTALRPDMLSEASKKVILPELTFLGKSAWRKPTRGRE